MNTRSFLVSALIAGIVIALLGNIPILNLVNCILCLWVWLGGALAVYLYKRFQPGGPGLSGGQGAGLGAVSGLIGAVIGFPLYLLFSTVLNRVFALLIQAFQIEGDFPLGTGTTTSTFAQAAVFFVLNLILYVIFGALSGLITADMLWKKEPSSRAVVDVPPIAPVVEAPPAPHAPETLPETPAEVIPPEPPAPENPSETPAESIPPEPPAPEAPLDPPAA